MSHRVVFRPGSSKRARIRNFARPWGRSVLGAESLSGGDINDAHAVTLGDGRTVFVKSNARSPKGMFASEARGLAWLAEAKALRVPEVLAVGPDDGDGAPAFLVLELIAPASRVRDFDERLGQRAGGAAPPRRPRLRSGPRQLHRPPAAVERQPGATWVEFYRDCRLEPQLRRAVDARRASPAMSTASNACSIAWPSWSAPTSRRRGCTAICGAATCWSTTPASPA